MFVSLNSKGLSPLDVRHKTKNNFSASKPLNPQLQTVPQIRIPLHAHKAYSKVGFAGTLASHKSWGAAVQLNGDVNFKLFTWPDAKKVFVEISDSVKPEQNFRDGFIKLVKDSAGAITNILADGDKSRLVELDRMGDGVFEKKFASSVAKNGEKYRFIIVKSNNEISSVKDPYAMKQENVHGWSTIYDHNKFKWNDKDWVEGNVKERISRLHDKISKKMSNPYNMRICEVNIATLTKNGDFESAKKEISKIAKSKIYNAIELMPVENTHSFNWGYDGVDKFAAQNSFLGGPDKLKELIDHAHQNKLNVVMDIVPNHMGPDGCALGDTGPYLDGDGLFGSSLNFERNDNNYVRQYIANSAMLWLRDYHCDAVRADMTKLMKSDYTMKEISAEVNYHHPHAFLIAEDARENDWRVTRPLNPEENQEGRVEEDHCKYIQQITNDQADLSNLGFGSEWDFPFHHKIAAAVLGNWDNHTRNIGSLDSAIKSSPHRVKYFMSHDEIGNMDGTRLITKAVTNDLGMFFRVNGNSDSEKGQRAAQSTQTLLKALVTGEADKMSTKEWEWAKFNRENEINNPVPLQALKESFKKAINKHKLAIGQTFVTPGPKMLFQGDESGQINPFKFFREFSHSSPEEELAMTKEKGYKSGKAALLDSKMTSIKYSPEAQKTLKQVNAFTKKLANIIDSNPALQGGAIQNTEVHDASSVYGMHRKEGDNEIFAVSNFSDFNYDKNYHIRFPEGKWQEVLNSDSEEFGGATKVATKNNDTLKSDGFVNSISLPGNSILIYKKIQST